MHPYLLPLQEQFNKHYNAENAAWTSAYMRNQFEYFGLDAKLWRRLTKEHIKQHPLPSGKELTKIVKELFKLPQREYQYFAIELLAAAKKQWEPPVIELIEHCIINKSWWDSVDHSATELTGPYFKLFPTEIERVTSKWNRSDNIWLQRSSIMFQKFYKKDTDTELLSKYIRHLSTSKEFFIQKAIGWALREYSKTNPDWVVDFVNKNKLAALSKKEALKRVIRYK